MPKTEFLEHQFREHGVYKEHVGCMYDAYRPLSRPTSSCFYEDTIALDEVAALAFWRCAASVC